MCLGRIFPLLGCMLLCLEAVEGTLKTTEPEPQGHHILFQQIVLQSIPRIKKGKTIYSFSQITVICFYRLTIYKALAISFALLEALTYS